MSDLVGESDFIAVLPHIIGYHPTNELWLVLAHGDDMVATLPCTLPLVPLDDQLSQQLLDVINRTGANQFVLVGYGPDNVVTPAFDALMRRLAPHLAMMAAYRVHDGRYYTFCGCPDACDTYTRGEPIPGESPAVARAVVEGWVAHPDRDAAHAYLTPVGGHERHAINYWALLTVLHMAADFLRPDNHDGTTVRPSVAVAVDDARARLAAAVRTYRDRSAHLDDKALNRLAFAVLVPPVFDEALALIGAAADTDRRHHTDTVDAHERLWLDIMRRTHASIAALPCVLYANAAMANGRAPLIPLMALDYAAAFDPTCAPAKTLYSTIERGITAREHVAALASRTVQQVRDAAGPARAEWMHAQAEKFVHVVGSFDRMDLLAAQRLTWKARKRPELPAAPDLRPPHLTA
ncbi:DUF4192 domain-containing protein [Nonomuraea polychroma]|uniref:DUF4192 domain-containing protein n=1 Tax=Nonomuraea polychroma TaxID=46176 RepID=UPI003D8AE160